MGLAAQAGWMSGLATGASIVGLAAQAGWISALATWVSVVGVHAQAWWKSAWATGASIVGVNVLQAVGAFSHVSRARTCTPYGGPCSG